MPVTAFTVLVVLSACTAQPVWQQDFSRMGDDVFSRLIRETHFVYKNPAGGVMRGPAVYFDRQAALERSRALWPKQRVNRVTRQFKSHGGNCFTERKSRRQRYLRCEVERHWRLIVRVGTSRRTSDDSSDIDAPGARLEFRFKRLPGRMVSLTDIKSVVIKKGKHSRQKHYYPVLSRSRLRN